MKKGPLRRKVKYKFDLLSTKFSLGILPNLI